MKTHMKISLSLMVMLIFSAFSGSSFSRQGGLEGSAWISTAIDGDTAMIGNMPTLAFEGEMVSGNANRFRR
jgi:hypothetical protein